MDIRYKLYPYPVLAYYSDDYVGCSFDTAIEVVKDGYNLRITFLATLDNKELLELIADGKAVIAYHMECAQTGYRTAVMTKEVETQKVIPDKDICGKLKICPFIVATEDIHNYVNTSFNNDYRGFKFQIDAGCVMAVSQQVNFDIDKDHNGLANTKSIFVITKDADQNALDMSVDIGRNKITIKLPERDYFRYQSMSQANEVQDTLNSMIIIPALVYVLSEISRRSPDDRDLDFGSYNWYKSIRKVMKKRFKKDLDGEELDATEIVGYAQRLIKSPMTGALEYLALGCNGEEEDDE